MSDNVSEIKNKLHIVDVLRGYLTLTQAGKNFKALCPFHKEKTPSFMVSPDRDMWYCFGCSEGGDMFKFVMKFEHIEFYEALKLLAEKAGVTLEHTGGAHDAHRQLYDINRLSKDFFVAQLLQNKSAYQAKALEYILSRGLTLDTIKEFEIGLAPTTGDSLFRNLVQQQRAVTDIERAGMIVKSDRGTYYDRFRGRIMFPLYNQFGKIIGFTGRILPIDGVQTENVGKYVNSPETPIFSKSHMLYGLHKSKSFIRDSQTAIVVEGQMDFLMMWQDGIKNVAASSGTALTVEQLQMLRRLSDTIILSFDTDVAGQAAAERSIDLALHEDFIVKILKTGTYKDAADVVKAEPGGMKQFVAEATNVMEFYYERYPVVGVDSRALKLHVRALLEKIRGIASPIERDRTLHDLAARTSISEEALREEMMQLRVEKLNIIPTPVQAMKKEVEQSKKEKIAERALVIVLQYPTLFGMFAAAMPYVTGDIKVLIDCCVEGVLKNVPEALSEQANMLTLRGSIESVPTESDAAHELTRLIVALKLEHCRFRQAELRSKIAQLEHASDEVGLHEALKEFDAITKELHTVQHAG